MSIYDAFLALPDVDFTCKWALGFGDPTLLRKLAEKHPERLTESAIDLGRVPWMIDLVQRYGIGAEQIRDHILNKGSIQDILSLIDEGLADVPTVHTQLEKRAADPDRVLEMLTLLRSKPQKLVEEVLVAMGA